MNLTAKQYQMTSTWNRDALLALPQIQWWLMTEQVKFRERGMNITRPAAIRGTLNAMKQAFGLKTSCRWSTFVTHLELFISVSEVVDKTTGERAPEGLQMKGGLPPVELPEGWS